LVAEEKIRADHDVSDGGLVTTLLEMAFAGNSGLSVDLEDPNCSDPIQYLFAEELGLVMEVRPEDATHVIDCFKKYEVPCVRIGTVQNDPIVRIRFNGPSSAKTPSRPISLEFRVPWPHAAGMKTLVVIVVVQCLNLVVFLWFNRVAWIRILALRQQLAVYKRKSKKPRLRNRDRLFWSLLSNIWRDWSSELILVRPETVIRWRKRKFREFRRRKSQRKTGRPAIPEEHMEFIRRISSDHPEYGEDRIALESGFPPCSPTPDSRRTPASGSPP
jgi:hypothetical protein